MYSTYGIHVCEIYGIYGIYGMHLHLQVVSVTMNEYEWYCYLHLGLWISGLQLDGIHYFKLIAFSFCERPVNIKWLGPEPYFNSVPTTYGNFWGVNHQTYGHIWCIFTALANPESSVINPEMVAPNTVTKGILYERQKRLLTGIGGNRYSWLEYQY